MSAQRTFCVKLRKQFACKQMQDLFRVKMISYTTVTKETNVK